MNESELAKAIGRLRGEWAERQGGELEARAIDWPELANRQAIDADLIVFPSRYLGEMCVRGWLRPMRQSVLSGELYDAADFYPVVQRDLSRWGGQVMAAPLGVTHPKELAVSEHPGMALLEEAAPSALSEDRLGVLFDSETMKPRITDDVFAEALRRVAERRSANAAGPNEIDADQLIPVLGFDDRLVAVSARSRNAASAFKLLEWLASADVSSQLASADKRLTPARPSLASSAKWYGSELTAGERMARAALAEELFNQQRVLVVPRIPGIDEYMAALDDAVNSAIKEGVETEEALAKAAARWEEITENRGRDAQRAAYLKHLGIEE